MRNVARFGGRSRWTPGLVRKPRRLRPVGRNSGTSTPINSPLVSRTRRGRQPSSSTTRGSSFSTRSTSAAELGIDLGKASVGIVQSTTILSVRSLTAARDCRTLLPRGPPLHPRLLLDLAVPPRLADAPAAEPLGRHRQPDGRDHQRDGQLAVRVRRPAATSPGSSPPAATPIRARRIPSSQYVVGRAQRHPCSHAGSAASGNTTPRAGTRRRRSLRSGTCRCGACSSTPTARIIPHAYSIAPPISRNTASQASRSRRPTGAALRRTGTARRPRSARRRRCPRGRGPARGRASTSGSWAGLMKTYFSIR